MKLPDVVIAVDTREQNPLEFPVSRPATLTTGDYAPLGLQELAAIERKSHGDLAACCGIGRKRFRAQLERLAELRYGALLIEPSIATILAGETHSRMAPKAILQTLSSWSVELGIPVWFAGSRRIATAIVLSICRHAVRHYGNPDAAQMAALAELGRTRAEATREERVLEAAGDYMKNANRNTTRRRR